VVEKKTTLISNLIEILVDLIALFTAGCPMKSGLLWTNLSRVQIREKLLLEKNISVSCPVIKRLLKSAGFVKRKPQKTKVLKAVSDRDEQFHYIAKLRKEFEISDLPVLSIDTKKKEMIGNFAREGSLYSREPIKVNDHDFNTFADGVAIPHGIYDTGKNICYLSIGTSHDTAEFVADNIEYHWNNSIKEFYPQAKKMLLLCDGGGSNSCRHYVVKEQFMKLSQRLGLKIVVAHYPAYCSKWNPIEHRAFSFISKKWQGAVFENYDIIKTLAEQTTTKTGFLVKAIINRIEYKTGKNASNDFMQNYPVKYSDFLPKWNYEFS